MATKKTLGSKKAKAPVKMARSKPEKPRASVRKASARGASKTAKKPAAEPPLAAKKSTVSGHVDRVLSQVVALLQATPGQTNRQLYERLDGADHRYLTQAIRRGIETGRVRNHGGTVSNIVQPSSKWYA